MLEITPPTTVAVASAPAPSAALARLACGHQFKAIAELVIISTCNRIELYAASSKAVFAELEDAEVDYIASAVREYYSSKAR